MRRKQARAKNQDEEGAMGDDDEDDDAEYYRKEVGQEPEKGGAIFWSFVLSVLLITFLLSSLADLFSERAKSKKSSLSGPAAKRARMEKKKMMDKESKKPTKGRFTNKGDRDDETSDYRMKKGGFKSGRGANKDFKRPGGGKFPANKKKVGFKGASKVHRKRWKMSV